MTARAERVGEPRRRDQDEIRGIVHTKLAQVELEPSHGKLLPGRRVEYTTAPSEYTIPPASSSENVTTPRSRQNTPARRPVPSALAHASLAAKRLA